MWLNGSWGLHRGPKNRSFHQISVRIRKMRCLHSGRFFRVLTHTVCANANASLKNSVRTTIESFHFFCSITVVFTKISFHWISSESWWCCDGKYFDLLWEKSNKNRPRAWIIITTRFSKRFISKWARLNWHFVSDHCAVLIFSIKVGHYFDLDFSTPIRDLLFFNKFLMISQLESMTLLCTHSGPREILPVLVWFFKLADFRS